MRCMSAVILVLALAGGVAAEELKQAPDFSLPNLDGKTVRLSEVNKERPVLLSFWATWCVPCPQEMQHLQRCHEKYEQAGLRILAVSIDGPKTMSKVKPFVSGRRFTFPVLLDSNNDVYRLYQVSAVPSVCLLKPGGTAVLHHVGYKPGDEVGLEKEIRKILGLPEGEGGASGSAGEANESETDSSGGAAAQDSSAAGAKPGGTAEETAR